MKLFFKLPLLALFTVLTFSSCSTDSIDDKADAMELSLFSKEAKTIEVEILELINNHRLSLGLNLLAERMLFNLFRLVIPDLWVVIVKEPTLTSFFYTPSKLATKGNM